MMRLSERYNGLLNIHKEAGFTSNDVVAKLRGHAARQALQKVNLLLMHGLLHINVSRSSRRPQCASLGEKGGGLRC